MRVAVEVVERRYHRLIIEGAASLDDAERMALAELKDEIGDMHGLEPMEVVEGYEADTEWGVQDAREVEP